MSFYKAAALAGHLLLVLIVVAGCAAPHAQAQDAAPAPGTKATRASVGEAIDVAAAWLATQQFPDGSYGVVVPEVGPRGDVGITGLVVHALAESPRRYTEEDGPFISNAVAYLLAQVQPDGGIYMPGQGLENYRTSVAVLALAALDERRPEKRYAKVIERARDYIAGLQCSEDSRVPYDRDQHKPAYGGIGYGSDLRPDLSNTHFAVEALHAAQLSEDSEVFQRVQLFLERCQNLKSGNEFLDGKQYKTTGDGGFMYAPGESKAADVKNPDGSRSFSSYGSMTYSGIKSYIYAGLKRDDPRVQAAWDWIRANYTVQENPGMATASDPKRGKMGLFYYYVVMARTLALMGAEEIETPDGVRHPWAAELGAQLLALRTPRGTWVNEVDRWMEGSETLTTAYAVEVLSIVSQHLKEK